MLIQNTTNTVQTLQATETPALGGVGNIVAPSVEQSNSVPAPDTKGIASKPLSTEQVKSAVLAINQAMSQSNQNLEFSIDSSTKMLVVKIVDTGTGQIIRQVPANEVLGIARSIDQFLKFQQGLLLKQKA
jgi:flagellar protein FlaG